MKIFLFVLLLLVLGGLYYVHQKKLDETVKNQAVIYTTSLQNDAKKAEDATKKANEAIQKMTQETQKADAEAEGK